MVNFNIFLENRFFLPVLFLLLFFGSAFNRSSPMEGKGLVSLWLQSHFFGRNLFWRKWEHRYQEEASRNLREDTCSYFPLFSRWGFVQLVLHTCSQGYFFSACRTVHVVCPAASTPPRVLILLLAKRVCGEVPRRLGHEALILASRVMIRQSAWS